MTNTQLPAATQKPTALLAELRRVIDARELLAEEDRKLSERRQQIERELLAFHEMSGLEKVAGAGVTVSFDPEAVRCNYDPERWDGIVRWAVETGNLHVIQRRLTDGKILDLVREGTELPEGLTLAPYTKISVRRV